MFHSCLTFISSIFQIHYTSAFFNFQFQFSIFQFPKSIFNFRISVCLLILQYCFFYRIYSPLRSKSLHRLPSKLSKSNKHIRPTVFSILHSFHVLLILFSFIFIILFIAQPLCTSHPPPFLSQVFLHHLCHIIPAVNHSTMFLFTFYLICHFSLNLLLSLLLISHAILFFIFYYYVVI